MSWAPSLASGRGRQPQQICTGDLLLCSSKQRGPHWTEYGNTFHKPSVGTGPGRSTCQGNRASPRVEVRRGLDRRLSRGQRREEGSFLGLMISLCGEAGHGCGAGEVGPQPPGRWLGGWGTLSWAAGSERWRQLLC